MARTAEKKQGPTELVVLNAKTEESLTDKQGELAVLEGQHESRIRAVALQIGYALPADATNADLIQRDIRANLNRSVEAVLEVGRGLVVLREACQHGNFLHRLDALEMEESVARRFMQSAQKFSKRATSHVLKAAGGQSKIFEMLVLDDESIEELALTGQTGELTLDDVATMSVKELRQQLRKIREEKSDVDKRSAAKTDRIMYLESKVDKKEVAPTDWPAAFTVLFDQAAAAQRKLTKAIHELNVLSVAANQVQPANAHEEAGLEEAQRHLAEEMKPTFDKGLKDLYEAAMLFGNTLGARADSVVFPA